MLPSAAALAPASSGIAAGQQPQQPASSTSPASSTVKVRCFVFMVAPLSSAAQQHHHGTRNASTAAGSTKTNTRPSVSGGGAWHCDGGCFQRLGVDEGMLSCPASEAAQPCRKVTLPGWTDRLPCCHIGAADPDDLRTGVLIACPGGQRKGAVVSPSSLPVVVVS